jgi:hypothetical protein
MSIDHNSFAEFALKLITSDEEVDWRMSAGRTYYASYHRALLSTQYCPDNSNLAMGSHERVTDQFLRHNTIKARSIAYVIQNMKKMRHVADYALDNNFSRADAVNQFAQYKILINKLAEFDAQFGAKMA